MHVLSLLWWFSAREEKVTGFVCFVFYFLFCFFELNIHMQFMAQSSSEIHFVVLSCVSSI